MRSRRTQMMKNGDSKCCYVKQTDVDAPSCEWWPINCSAQPLQTFLIRQIWVIQTERGSRQCQAAKWDLVPSVSQGLALNLWNNCIPGDDKPRMKDTSGCFWTQTKLTDKELDRQSGGRWMCKRMEGGCAAAGGESSTQPRFAAGSNKTSKRRSGEQWRSSLSLSEVIFNPVSSRTMPYWGP